MADTGDLVSIKLVVDRLMQNPVMKDLQYEFIIDKAIEVLTILDAPAAYVTRREQLNVVGYRASKPVQMIKVMGIARTDQDVYTALNTSEDIGQEFWNDGDRTVMRESNTYSLNSKYINVNFEEGSIDVIYKMVATDEECYPLILNNPTLLRCIESYIKYRWFDILNDMDMISDRKLNKAETDYCFNVAQADVNLKMPSIDEMETLTNMITQILPSRTDFTNRFEFLGEQEFMRIH